MSTAAPHLAEQHRQLLRDSAISDEIARERGYVTATTKAGLAGLGFGSSQQRVPALVVPVWGVSGEIVTYQARPDQPRICDGKPLKYETPRGSSMRLDVPRRVRGRLGDPKVPLFVTEGARKADAAVSAELCCIALLGVWNWRGTNENGGKTALADWESVALNDRAVYLAFDSDAMVKQQVHDALERLAAFLGSRGADVRYVHLPHGDGAAKVGLDDYLAAGHTVEQLLACASDVLQAAEPPDPKPPEAPLRATDELLMDVVAFVDRYVVLPSHRAALAVALWVLHTWAFEGAHATPYLVVQSATKRSGKTRLLEVLALLVRRPWMIAAASEAAIFRKIAAERPTLLLDEVDAIFASSSERTEPVRGLLNAGNRPGAAVARVVGEGANLQTVDFSVYCPKVLGGIDTGRWPDTILDRAVRFVLQRKKRSEQVARFRHRDADADAEPLRRALELWAREHAEALLDARPEPPADLNDRADEAWEPLLAIADLAGGDFPQLARRAAIGLAADEDEDDEAHGVRLLRALRGVFADRTMLPTEDLLEQLNADDELPFGVWRKGDGLDARGLARLLKPFGIRPRTIRVGDATAKGYRREQFTDAWERYSEAPHTGEGPSGHTTAVTAVTTAAQSQKPAIAEPSHEADVTASENGANARGATDVTAVTARNPQDGTETDSGASNGPGNGRPPETLLELLGSEDAVVDAIAEAFDCTELEGR